jgi:predicted dehydrogenase
MTQISVALIGFGYWGPNLARNFYQLPTSKLAAVCDQDMSRLAEVERLYPMSRTKTKYRELLTDPSIEGVVIATPAQTHYTLAQEALLAGKHVLVEKPLAMDSTQAEELIEIAARQNKILMVGHIFEYNPAVHKIKELISGGQIGGLYYIYSTRVNLGRVQSDLNALWSITPHDISILIYLLEAMPLEVSARGASYLNKSVEDVVFVSLLFPQGVIAQVHGSWLDPSKVRRMTVVGSKKMIIYDDVDDEGKVKVYEKGVYQKGDDIYGEFQYKLHSGDIYIPKIDMTEPLRNECAHFIECIQKGKRPLTDGENGLRVVKVLEAAQKSLENRGTVMQIDRD